MIERLKKIESQQMLDLLGERDAWQQGGQRVMRLARPVGEYQLWIHRMADFGRIRGQWHPHPWPMAVHVLAGEYYQEFGYSVDFAEPEVSAKSYMQANSYYEITDKDMWHYVTPINECCYTTMLTAASWTPEVLETGLQKTSDEKPLITVSKKEAEALLDWFTAYYENYYKEQA